MATAAERIADLKKKLADEVSNVGVELAKQLAGVAETYKTMIEIGGKDVWKDPQYGQSLEDLGLTAVTEEKKARKPRGSFPPVSTEAVEEMIKAKGSEGCLAGELQKHFGPSFAKWRKDNESKYDITKDGTSKIWKLKGKKK